MATEATVQYFVDAARTGKLSAVKERIQEGFNVDDKFHVGVAWTMRPQGARAYCVYYKAFAFRISKDQCWKHVINI